MFNAFAKITTPTDKTKDLKRALAELVKKDVLVGVPQESSSSQGDITNAELAYIHTHGIRQSEMRHEMQANLDAGIKYSKAHQMYLQAHGSPLWHAPPRPIIEPAIEDKENQKPITDELEAAAKAALDGDTSAAERHVEKAGMIGQNVVRAWFSNPENGWDPNAEVTVKNKGSSQPLVDTGELRKSITYVVRDRK